MLTKKFVELIERADGGILDLNQAADLLQVRVTCRGRYRRAPRLPGRCSKAPRAWRRPHP
jgi:hypothetical protein